MTFLYPIYDRIQRISDNHWRKIIVGVTIIGAISSLAMLAGRQTALELADQVVIPILVAVTTLLEISAFIFIYGELVLFYY